MNFRYLERRRDAGHPFRANPDGGVLALTFVTALLARPRKVGVPCQDHLRECSRRAVYRRASKHQIVGKSWHFFGGGECRATAAPASRSMASAEIARINGLDILASDLRRV